MATLAALVALAAPSPSLAAQSTIEVHWDNLTGNAFKRAGDYTSDFALGDGANGAWQLLPSGSASPELGFIKTANTGSGSVEVHLDTLAGGIYRRVGDFASDFSPADAANGAFVLFGSANGAPELGFVKLRNTGSGKVEVHWDVLSGGVYRRAGDVATDFSSGDAGNGVWDLLPGASAGGAPELGFVKVFNTGSGTVEVHWDTFNGGTYTRAGDATSDFSPADNDNGVWQLLPTSSTTPELGFVKLRSTGSRAIEAHWDLLSGGVYRRAGDVASDFGLADAGNGVWQLIPTSTTTPQLGFVKLESAPARPPPVQVLPAPHTQSTPVTVVLPVPTARRYVRVKIRMSWTWNGRHTRLVRIRIGRLPAGGAVSVRCRGAGCPAPRSRVAHARRVRSLVGALRGQRYRAGDRLFVTVTAPGRIPERAVILIRNGRLPAVRAR